MDQGNLLHIIWIQNYQAMQQKGEKEVYINTVASSLINRKRLRNAEQKNEKTEKVKQIEQKMSSLFGRFDTSIQQCKKYNQAKIHRMYEIQIRDLKEQVKMLSERVLVEQQARSPSKKFVEELLDQLVYLKNENEKLMKVQKQMQVEIDMIKVKTFISTMDSSDLESKISSIGSENELTKKVLESYMKEKQSFDEEIQVQIRKYLRKRHKQRQNFLDNRSPFNKFLEKWLKQHTKESLQKLLSDIDEWVNKNFVKGEKKDNKMNLKFNLQDMGLGTRQYSSVVTSKARLRTLPDAAGGIRSTNPYLPSIKKEKKLILH